MRRVKKEETKRRAAGGEAEEELNYLATVNSPSCTCGALLYSSNLLTECT